MDDGIGKCAACGSTHCIIEDEGICHDCMPGVRWERERVVRMGRALATMRRREWKAIGLTKDPAGLLEQFVDFLEAGGVE